MKLLHITALTAALAFNMAPAMASEDDENRKLLVYGIQMMGNECAAIVGAPVIRDEEMAFDVTCAQNADGSGKKTLYFVQILNGQFVVEIQ